MGRVYPYPVKSDEQERLHPLHVEGRGVERLFWNFSLEKSGKMLFLRAEEKTLHYSCPCQGL